MSYIPFHLYAVSTSVMASLPLSLSQQEATVLVSTTISYSAAVLQTILPTSSLQSYMSSESVSIIQNTSTYKPPSQLGTIYPTSIIFPTLSFSTSTVAKCLMSSVNTDFQATFSHSPSSASQSLDTSKVATTILIIPHVSTNNILSETATPVAFSSPSTSSMLENTVIFISVVIASAGLIILFIIITVAIIIFILRRQNNKISQHPVSINEQVELQQTSATLPLILTTTTTSNNSMCVLVQITLYLICILTCPAGFIFILKSITNKMM